MSVSPRVLIIDNRHEVLELNRILLEAEGYNAQGYSYAEVTPHIFTHKDEPVVVLLDLPPGDEAPWALLRRLQHDEATRHAGIVVTSEMAALVNRALRDKSLGVTAGLVIPFDIEALYTAISAAAQHKPAPLSAPVPLPLLQRMAGALRRSESKIATRWVQGLSLMEAFRLRPQLSLKEVEGQGPALIQAIADALDMQESTSALVPMRVGIRVDTARDHARLRLAQGLRASDIAYELAALRREIWRELSGHILAEQDSKEIKLSLLKDVQELWRRLHTALDELLFAMLDTWDEGRSQ